MTDEISITSDEKGQLELAGGEDIKAWRINKGLSLGQLADQIGISKSTLFKAEEGGDLWNQSRKAIADYFGQKVTGKGGIWPELLEEPVGAER